MGQEEFNLIISEWGHTINVTKKIQVESFRVFSYESY